MDVCPIAFAHRLSDTYPMSEKDLEEVHPDEYYAGGFEMLELLEECALKPLADAIEHERLIAEDLGCVVIAHEATVMGVISRWIPEGDHAAELMTDVDWQTLAEWRRELLERDES